MEFDDIWITKSANEDVLIDRNSPCRFCGGNKLKLLSMRIDSIQHPFYIGNDFVHMEMPVLMGSGQCSSGCNGSPVVFHEKTGKWVHYGNDTDSLIQQMVADKAKKFQQHFDTHPDCMTGPTCKQFLDIASTEKDKLEKFMKKQQLALFLDLE